MLTTFHWSDASPSSPFAADRRDDSYQGNGNAVAYSTPLSIWETDDKIQVEMDLPGLDTDAIDLNYKDGMLWIRGERRFAGQEGQLRYNSRWFGPFERIIRLPDVIDPASIEAELVNGVLMITLLKKAEALPKRVQVRSGKST